MSADFGEAVNAFAECERITASLKRRAIQNDDLRAMIALVDVARMATRAVNDLWFERPIFDPFSGGSSNGRLKARRAALHFFIGTDQDFPVLHFWNPAGALRKVDDDQNEILRGLKFGLFKGSARKGNQMRMLLDEIIIPHFANIQNGPAQRNGVGGEVWRLPPLSGESLSKWADVIVRWLWEKNPSEMKKKGSKLYQLANPEQELERERRKKKKRRRWENNMRDSPLREGRDKSVADTKIAVRSAMREKRTSEMQVRKRHISEGMKAAITRYFKRHLASGETSPSF